MDKIKEIEKIVYSVLNAYAFPPVVTNYKNGKIDTIQDGYIKDIDGKFRKIANEIAVKVKSI